MKTTEEKAKKYDEALEWMRELYPGLHGATKEDAEHYFPELKESEDERMLGAIRLALTDVPEERFTTEGTSLSEVLAWMEKQKEQKPVTINQDEKEFLADEITAFLCNYDKEFDGEDPVPSEVAEHFYLLGKQAQEQKPVINIDQLKSMMLQYLQEAANEKDDSAIEADTDKWARKILGYDFEQKPVDDKAFEEWIDVWYNEHHRDGYITMDEREFKNFCRGIRNMYQQKPAEWDEEDESMRKTIIQVLESFVSQADCESNPSLSCSYPTYRREIEWLKSLRPQPKQKPEAKLTGWVARDSKYNSYFGLGLVLFKGKPRRSGECWSGAIAAQLPWEMFPDLKWMDEPMEVEITITKK